MLKLNPDPTFKAPVEIYVPGHAVPVPVVFSFKYRDVDELQALLAKKLTGVEALMSILEGWDGIDAEFSETNVRTLAKKYPGIDMPIFRAYMFELQQARLGNLKAPSA